MCKYFSCQKSDVVILQGLSGKTDLDEAKAAMIAETAEEFFMTPVVHLIPEKDKEKQVCICICLLLHPRQNFVLIKNIFKFDSSTEDDFSGCRSQKICNRNLTKHNDKAGKIGRRERIFCW